MFKTDWIIYIMRNAEGKEERVEEWEVPIWQKRGYEVVGKHDMRPGRI